ncbi:MAG: undecaprenyl/decaprenyl-phosphate alpha-N-acetylglucosaminyl 1-phosphate transferase [Clostridia bacterium]|nr:undecaprenyl/decaprenyl-phosphate alpha-N-acetylglucosaminyl 1-phosphate transferase [Clostridia bacterium]
MIVNMVIYSLIIITFICCLILTPISIAIAKKYDIVDIPKDKRKIHSVAMPRIGGVSIVISMIIGLAIYYFLTRMVSSVALNEKFVGYFVGAIIISVMGLVDDIINLRARYKFIFQLIAASIIYFFGITIEGIKIPFLYPYMIDFGFLSFPITLIWIIGITNAVNLIDGLDGLAAGISAISATALLTIFIATSASLEAIIITAVMVGATLGFLPYNFNPAKTFMGDVGSNFLGYTLAVVSVLGFAKGYTMLAIIAPILTLGVPIFDTLFAMARRLINRKPVLQPDGGHVHHRLLKRGFSQKQAVLILYTATSILCMIAVVIISADIWKLLLLIIATIVFVGIGLLKTKEKVDINDNNEKSE